MSKKKEIKLEELTEEEKLKEINPTIPNDQILSSISIFEYLFLL